MPVRALRDLSFLARVTMSFAKRCVQIYLSTHRHWDAVRKTRGLATHGEPYLSSWDTRTEGSGVD